MGCNIAVEAACSETMTKFAKICHTDLVECQESSLLGDENMAKKEMLKLALTEAEGSGISHRKVMDIIHDVKGRMHGG